MKTERFPELIGLKVSADLAADIRRAAHDDDRPISAFLRRLITSALRPAPGAGSDARPRTDHEAG